MDYTHNPEGNLSPGKINHEILARSYGTIPPKRVLELNHNLSEDGLKEFTQAAVDLELPGKCSQSVCIEDLGQGIIVIAHKLLVVPS